MGFHVGQKVVYVGIEGQFTQKAITLCAKDVDFSLKKGTVYTVRSVGMSDFVSHDGVKVTLLDCRLEGVKRVTRTNGDLRLTDHDAAYAQKLFRPVENIEDSEVIKLFRKIAADATAARKITVMGPERINK